MGCHSNHSLAASCRLQHSPPKPGPCPTLGVDPPPLPLPLPAEQTLPTLNVDVPRLLRVEYHKRLQMARVKRQHELEALLKSGKLAVGHCRVSMSATPEASAC